MLDTGIADRLRAAGLEVVEVDGWTSRSAGSFDPRGSVDHHTAGPPSGDAPSLNVCIHGRSDLPGPLCNVLIGRARNTCYVIAAGRANHAGSGGWEGLAGNSSVYGIERENVGTGAEPWRPDQLDAAARAHAALIRGRAEARKVCRHAEWAPGRKVDTHDVNGDDLRGRVAFYLAGGAPTPAPEQGVFDMFVAIDSVGLYAVIGHVLFTFRDLAAYGAAMAASPNVPAMVIGPESSLVDRQDLAQNLTAQHYAVVVR